MNSYHNLNASDFIKSNDALYETVLFDSTLMSESPKEKILLSKSFREDMHYEAMRIGKSFNSLDSKEFQEIQDSLWDKQYKAQFDTVSQSVACICAVYPPITIPAGPAGFYPHNSQGRQRTANAGDCGDCDLETFYPINQDRLQWVTSAGGVYYATQAGKLMMRKVGFNRILIGYGAVNSVFLTSEYLAQVAYRMIP